MNTSSSSQQTLPLAHTPIKSHYYNVDNGSRHQASPYENGNGYSSGQYSNRYGNGKDFILIGIMFRCTSEAPYQL